MLTKVRRIANSKNSVNNKIARRAMDLRIIYYGTIEVSLSYVYQILYQMKALNISKWKLCITRGNSGKTSYIPKV